MMMMMKLGNLNQKFAWLLSSVVCHVNDSRYFHLVPYYGYHILSESLWISPPFVVIYGPGTQSEVENLNLTVRSEW